MNTILELIRYGFPGYLIVASASAITYELGVLPRTASFYEDFGTIIGAMALIVGPLIGFVVHQLYFLIWFERRESYTTQDRRCLRTLCAYHKSVQADGEEDADSDKELAKSAYLTWKFMMTGVMGDLKVSEIILQRLSSLRNFSHAFGAIVVSALLSVSSVLVTALLARSWGVSFTVIVAAGTTIAALFFVQRRGLTARIEEIEDGLMRTNIRDFHTGMLRIRHLEAQPWT